MVMGALRPEEGETSLEDDTKRETTGRVMNPLVIPVIAIMTPRMVTTVVVENRAGDNIPPSEEHASTKDPQIQKKGCQNPITAET